MKTRLLNWAGWLVCTLLLGCALVAAADTRVVVAVRVLWSDGSVGDWISVSPATAPTTVPTTVPTTAPTLPPRTIRKAPDAVVRGDGWAPTDARASVVRIQDLVLDGWKQNLVFEKDPRALIASNLISINAFRDDPSQVFQGQGAYLSASGPSTFDGCYFDHNGWKDDQPGGKNPFRHHIYQNLGCGPLTAVECIFADAAAAGAQTRTPGAKFIRCVFLNNSINAIAVNTATFEDCDFYGASRSIELTDDKPPKPKAWQGNAGIMAFDTVRLKGNWFIGRPGQEAPTTEFGVKSYNAGCLAIGSDHRDNPDRTGSFVDLGGNRIIAWPTASPGQREADLPGAIKVGKAVAYDYKPVLATIAANKISIKDARAKISAELRQAASK